ncbi:MAG: hypothetical protein ACJ8BW_40575 [Ktedonobacteraceae bacterium]
MSNKDGFGLSLPKLPLPKDTVCYTIILPNSPEIIQAFEGEIYFLGQWVAWQRDLNKTGRVAAQVFKDLYQMLHHQPCKPVSGSIVQEEPMTIQTDCDCMTTVTCPEGGTKTLATTDDIKRAGIVGGNSPSAPPNGGVINECESFDANAVLLIPGLLNSGDIITLSNADGSGYDGAGTRWYCPDGNQLFVTCQADTTFLDGADPIPTSPHMQLIIQINGAFYPIGVGSPLVIPGGISNQQGWFQVNDASLTNNFGKYSICYTVKNNQAGTWSHTFDFTVGSQGWAYNTRLSDNAPFANYVLGVGWQSVVLTPGGFNDLDIFIPCLANVATVTIFVNDSVAFGWNVRRDGDIHTVGAVAIDAGTTAGIGNETLFSGSGASVSSNLMFGAGAAGAPSTLTIMKIVVTGTGVNPFI